MKRKSQSESEVKEFKSEEEKHNSELVENIKDKIYFVRRKWLDNTPWYNETSERGFGNGE